MRNLAETPTLRDTFAMAAIQGLASSISWTPGLFVHEDEMASDAYAIADAMLKESEKPPQ